MQKEGANVKAREIKTELSNKEVYVRNAGGNTLNPIDTVCLGFTWSWVKKYEKVPMWEMIMGMVDKEHAKALIDLQSHMHRARMDYLSKNPRPTPYKGKGSATATKVEKVLQGHKTKFVSIETELDNVNTLE